MIGNALVGNAEAVIAYVNAKTDIVYVNATTDIELEYNSKNKEFGRDGLENVTVADIFTKTVQFNRPQTDSLSIAEQFVLAVQYNLAFSESLTSTDTFSWTLAQTISDSVVTADTPGIGAIHKVSPSESISVLDMQMMYHDGMLNTNMLNTRLISAGDTAIVGTDVTIT